MNGDAVDTVCNAMATESPLTMSEAIDHDDEPLFSLLLSEENCVMMDGGFGSYDSRYAMRTIDSVLLIEGVLRIILGICIIGFLYTAIRLQESVLIWALLRCRRKMERWNVFLARFGCRLMDTQCGIRGLMVFDNNGR
jgi:hypothetical protein